MLNDQCFFITMVNRINIIACLLFSLVLSINSFSQQSSVGFIEWDTASLKQISPVGSGGVYPRMIQLQNGNLLAVYATSGNVVAVASSDEGLTWSVPVVIAERRNEVNMDTPDLLQLKNGNIIACYGTRPQKALRGNPEAGKRFEIRISRSSDGGNTWRGEQILYAAGESFKNGCWEPSAIQLPGGSIQLFFANEAPYTESDEQNISMLSSIDNGQTWTINPQIISFRARSRDGMPVPVLLRKSNQLVVAIEDPGTKNFKPYAVHSNTNGHWEKIVDDNDPNRDYSLKEKIPDSTYAGAPYLRQLSTGETILSFQSTEGRIRNRDSNSVMTVAVRDGQAKNFTNKSMPFVVPEGYNALWNSLCVLKDDTIIAVTSTNGYSKGRTEVWMIKGHLIKEK